MRQYASFWEILRTKHSNFWGICVICWKGATLCRKIMIIQFQYATVCTDVPEENLPLFCKWRRFLINPHFQSSNSAKWCILKINFHNLSAHGCKMTYLPSKLCIFHSNMSNCWGIGGVGFPMKQLIVQNFTLFKVCIVAVKQVISRCFVIKHTP